MNRNKEPIFTKAGKLRKMDNAGVSCMTIGKTISTQRTTKTKRLSSFSVIFRSNLGLTLFFFSVFSTSPYFVIPSATAADGAADTDG